MPTLVLVRHAQAAYNYPDRARPLTEAGRDQAARLGATLAREVGAFDVAVSSGEACLIVGHEPVISYAGYILARQEDRGAADRGVPTATALVLSFEGAWEDLAPGTCAMRVFYTPPTR